MFRVKKSQLNEAEKKDQEMKGKVVVCVLGGLFAVLLFNLFGIAICIPNVNCSYLDIRGACENTCIDYEVSCQINPNGGTGNECLGGRKCIQRDWIDGMPSYDFICDYSQTGSVSCLTNGILVYYTENKKGTASCHYSPDVDNCFPTIPCYCTESTVSDCVALRCTGSVCM